MCYSVIVGTCTILTGEFIGKIYLSKDLEFSEGGGGLVRYGGGFGGRSRLSEALGYLVQNPAI